MHDVIPEDSQLQALLRELLTPEVRVRIAETLDSPINKPHRPLLHPRFTGARCM